MELRIVCDQCSAEYKVQDEKVQQNPKRFSCKRCNQVIVLKPGPNGVEATGGSIRSPFMADFPSRFGNFSDLKRLASGGMGDIYLAKLGGAEGFEREVVLKVLHPHLARDESFAKAMVDEAKLTVVLHHPNIVQMYNLEKSGELLYCVMEYVPGKSLAIVQRGYRKKGSTIPLKMAVYIAIEALAGLAYAHEITDRNGKSLGIVHRDISPQNILVTKEGWIKIIDFGIAKAATRMSHTAPGMIKGKFAYMAPEQFKGESDHRVDLFAMGVVLWETLAGVRLFHSSTDVDTLHKVLHMEPPPISLTRSEIPKELDVILRKALAKDPNKRYNTASEFRNDLIKFVAPATMEELRSLVDIDAAAVEDVSESVMTKAESSDFRDITPVVEASMTKAYPSLEATIASPGVRRVLWSTLGLLLLAGIGAGIYFGLPYLNAARTTVQTEDAGIVLPPLLDGADAGVKGQDASVVAGPDPTEEDAGTPVATNDTKKKGWDGGIRIAKSDRDERTEPKEPPVKLTQEMISKLVFRSGGRFQGCADTHLAKDGAAPDVVLMLTFSIESSGKVNKVGLKPENLESSPFGRCMVKQVASLKFPRHQDANLTVSFPLKFKVEKK